MTNNQKRLAIFLPGLYGGGAERTMLNLAQGIAAQGYPVDLVLAHAEGPYLAQVPDSVRVVDLKTSRVLSSLPALVRYLRQEQPTALLSALSRANIVAVWARRLAGGPERVIVNEQDTLSSWAREPGDWRRKITLPMASYFYRWADKVVAVSHGVADDLVEVVRIAEAQVKVIFNPGITPALRQKAEMPLDHPWFQPDQPPVLLAVGRLSKQKDFETLIKAFAILRQAQPVRLLILGEGPERATLETLIDTLNLSQDVSLPGFVDNPYPYMVRAAAFVLSSLHEGLPTVLVEALYCGTPIVATDCPSGPREILENGQLGSLVPMSDPASLASAVQNVLDGNAPRPTCESWQSYTLEVVSSQYIEALLGPGCHKDHAIKG